jgi:hypothetical protein
MKKSDENWVTIYLIFDLFVQLIMLPARHSFAEDMTEWYLFSTNDHTF